LPAVLPFLDSTSKCRFFGPFLWACSTRRQFSPFTLFQRIFIAPASLPLSRPARLLSLRQRSSSYPPPFYNPLYPDFNHAPLLSSSQPIGCLPLSPLSSLFFAWHTEAFLPVSCSSSLLHDRFFHHDEPYRSPHTVLHSSRPPRAA